MSAENAGAGLARPDSDSALSLMSIKQPHTTTAASRVSRCAIINKESENDVSTLIRSCFWGRKPPFEK